VPDKQRAAAERAIEVAANLVSVAQGCRRHIASVWPLVIFIATGDEGRNWLADRAGLQHRRLQGKSRTAEQMDLDASILNELRDRDHGVALPVEALSHDHAMGRFHEFMRLFERAFAQRAKKLAAPLGEFLSSRFGCRESELQRWFEELRDPATHADVRAEFLLEADVRPVIDRVEQAAFDVLLNKATWRDPSTTRREVWTPPAGTTVASGGAFIVQGTRPVTQGMLLDEYGAFPMDLGGAITPRPGKWWPQTDEPDSRTEEFPIQMVERRPPPGNPAPTVPPASCRHSAQRFPPTLGAAPPLPGPGAKRPPGRRVPMRASNSSATTSPRASWPAARRSTTPAIASTAAISRSARAQRRRRDRADLTLTPPGRTIGLGPIGGALPQSPGVLGVRCVTRSGGTPLPVSVWARK
jgi:hypothetical protein